VKASRPRDFWLADGLQRHADGCLEMLTNPGDLNELTHDIIGGAISVHQALGPGLLESAYKACLATELRARHHEVAERMPVPLVYRGVKIAAAFRIDMLVDDRVIVELKSIDKLAAIHKSQLLTYLRLSGRPVGLLINFNEQVLKDGIRRVINPQAAAT
jgi:GxxExxY protein